MHQRTSSSNLPVCNMLISRSVTPARTFRQSVPRSCIKHLATVSQRRHMSLPPPAAHAGSSSCQTITLNVVELTPEAFAPFGKVVSPQEDGKAFDQDDAQLQLDKGTPRFYIMRIPRRGMRFSRITFHAQVTQCLGSLAPIAPWYLVVSRPTGSVASPPRPEAGQLTAFRVPHGVFLAMHAATWHAGPLFEEADHMDFYNLELADTNVVDHNTHDYASEGLVVELVES